MIERALLIFGYVALGVGAFIIYNTFAIIIAQRTHELALLRALGATRRQVSWSVVLEALAVGTIASAIGVVLGILIGIGLKTALEALNFGPTDIPTVVRPRDVIIAVAIGTVVTTFSAALPALRASRVSPLAALREVAYDQSRVTWKRVTTRRGIARGRRAPDHAGVVREPPRIYCSASAVARWWPSWA